MASDGQGVIDGSCSPPSATLPGIDFGTIQNGTIITRRIRITNQGLGNLTLTGIHIDSTNPVFSYVGPASPTVSSAQWIDVDVSFSPAARGTENGHLLMTTNDPTRAQIDLPLTGAGGGSHAGLCVTPTPLAFGTLPVTFSRTLQLHVQNCSTGAQQLTAIALQNPSGVEVFAFGTNGPPALPVNIAVGEEIILDVVYSPSQVEAPPASDDRGTIDLRSADDSISVLLSGRGGLAACTADGGPIVPIGAVQVKNGDTTIDPATTTLTPFSLLTLDASLLAAPDGQMITSYDWRIASQPSGSRAVIGGTGSVVTFAPPLEGDYTFELVVHEGDFCQSLPITLTIHVAIQAAVYVRLTWAESYGDVDLHYVGPGGTYYADSTSNLSDLDWTHSLMTAPGAEAPTQTGQRLTDYWGLNNTCHPNGTTTDDATFDIDQRAGYGPEAVTHNRPFDGTYTVAAHYYCNGSGTTATPSIDIFVNGALVWHGTKPGMTKRQVWNAAQIVVSNNGTSITVVPLTTALFTDTHGC